jgi:hypothetical protein
MRKMDMWISPDTSSPQMIVLALTWALRILALRGDYEAQRALLEFLPVVEFVCPTIPPSYIQNLATQIGRQGILPIVLGTEE